MLKKLWIILFFLLISKSAFGVLTQGDVTIKLAGGTYDTWAGFWNDLGNLTGDITCTVDASAFTEAAAPGVLTESLGGHTLHVLPAAFPTATDASDGARFTCNYAGTFLDVGLEGPGTLIIEGIVTIEGTSAPDFAYEFTGIGTDFDCTLRRCIVKSCETGIYHHDTTLQTTKIYNNIFFDQSNWGIYVAQDIAGAVIANNTIVDCDIGFYAGDEEVTFENNISYSNTTQDWDEIEVLTIGNNNADSDATAEDADWGGGGANNVNSIADPFNNFAADDFSITAEGVVGTAGKDLSGTFTKDFFDTGRINWSIGACEYETPAAGGGQVIIIRMMD